MKQVMLAHSFKESKVKYPAIAQPKLDGIRCRAVVSNGEVKLYSRDNKDIVSMVHIQQELSNFPDGEYDGELYTNKLTFEKINGIVRRHYADHESVQIEYHIYDIIEFNVPYSVRWNKLHAILNQPANNYTYTKLLGIRYIQSTVELETVHRAYLSNGYEGTMVRTQTYDRKTKLWSDPGYETEANQGKRRSWSLLKYKDFMDAEFRIIGIEEEKDLAGKPKGRTGAFILSLDDGTNESSTKTFKASGLTDDTKVDSWNNPTKYIGKYATIKYFEMSSDGVPRFPSFIAVRWDNSDEV